MKKVMMAVLASLAVTGCSEQSARAGIAQDAMCLFSEISSAKTDCKNGQVAMFAPSRWGNEQLPVYAAANFCDFRYSIVQTNGGVSCIFTDVRLKEKPADKTEPAPPAK